MKTKKPDLPDGYEDIALVLFRALERASAGKGRQRHGRSADGIDRPFNRQVMMEATRMVGIGGPLYQVIKKAAEASTMVDRGWVEAARLELLDIIVYAAGAVMALDERIDTGEEKGAGE